MLTSHHKFGLSNVLECLLALTTLAIARLPGLYLVSTHAQGARALCTTPFHVVFVCFHRLLRSLPYLEPGCVPGAEAS